MRRRKGGLEGKKLEEKEQLKLIKWEASKSGDGERRQE